MAMRVAIALCTLQFLSNTALGRFFLELILVEIVAPVKVKRFYFKNANLSKNNAFFLVKFKEHNVLLKYKSTFKLELKP